MSVVIDLNKKLVTKEGILCYIQDLDIYRYYIGKDIDLAKNIKSPLRDDDENPSFGFFVGSSNEICFNDFGKTTGDFVKFVELYFGLTYFEALSKIVIDFNLTPHFIYKQVFKTSKDYNPKKLKSRERFLSTANKKTLGKRARAYNAQDILFWEQFGISKTTLLHYKVEPIDMIFFDGHPIKADKFAYAFNEFKDNKRTIKIYQPYSKNYKWLNNHNDSVWQGWSQLPKQGQELIITSSLKDAMSIVDVLNIPSVALQAEGVMPKKKVIEELKQRFLRIIVFYDNDFDKEKDNNIGQIQSEKLAKEFDLIQYCIPDRYQSKDFSDLIKNHGRNEAKEIFETCIEMPF